MLFPVGIVVPDTEGFFVVLVLQGREEVIDYVFLRIVAEVPCQNQAQQHDSGDGDDPDTPLARGYNVVRLCFEQGHDYSSLLRRAKQKAGFLDSLPSG